MKTIYLIGGTMGVGKTTTCQLLKKKLHNSVFLDGLDTLNCTVKEISLICDEVSLKARLEQDIKEGKRTEDVIARSVARLPLYQGLQTVKIDTTNKSVEEVAGEIARTK